MYVRTHTTYTSPLLYVSLSLSPPSSSASSSLPPPIYIYRTLGLSPTPQCTATRSTLVSHRLSIYPSIYPSIHLSTYLSIHPSIHSTTLLLPPPPFPSQKPQKQQKTPATLIGQDSHTPTPTPTPTATHHQHRSCITTTQVTTHTPTRPHSARGTRGMTHAIRTTPTGVDGKIT